MAAHYRRAKQGKQYKDYTFDRNNAVVYPISKMGLGLCISMDAKRALKGHGGYGPYGRFRVEKHGEHVISLVNNASGGYVRLQADRVDCDGRKGSEFTKFEVCLHDDHQHICRLRSTRFKARYLSVNEKNQVGSSDVKNDDTLFMFRCVGEAKDNFAPLPSNKEHFPLAHRKVHKPYNFKSSEVVFILPKHRKGLAHGWGTNKVHGNGGYGVFGYWQVEFCGEDHETVRLRHVSTRGFLQMQDEKEVITGGDGTDKTTHWKVIHVDGYDDLVKFQSIANGEKFLRCEKDGNVRVGPDGDVALFRLKARVPRTPNFDSLSNHGDGDFPLERKQKTIPHQHHDFNLNETCYLVTKKAQTACQPPETRKLNGGGTFGPYARWDVQFVGDDTVRFRNNHSGHYIRLAEDGETVDCHGNGGPYGQFKIHYINGCHNYVMFESIKHSGKYLAFGGKGKAYAGTGGPFCEFRVRRHTHVE